MGGYLCLPLRWNVWRHVLINYALLRLKHLIPNHTGRSPIALLLLKEVIIVLIEELADLYNLLRGKVATQQIINQGLCFV